MAKRYRSGSIDVTTSVDICDVLDELSDEALIEEAKARDLTFNGSDYSQDITAAYEALRNGHAAEALSILDRICNPKWATQEACMDAYRKARQ